MPKVFKDIGPFAEICLYQCRANRLTVVVELVKICRISRQTLTYTR